MPAAKVKYGVKNKNGYTASVTGIEAYERPLVLNKGELGQIIRALNLAAAAREALGEADSFGSRCDKSLRERLIIISDEEQPT